MKHVKCPESGLLLPSNQVDQKVALKQLIDQYVEKAVMMHQHLDYPYFLTFHARFNKHNPEEFSVDAPKITKKIPPFISNTMVFWVCNKRGVCELLWVVMPKKSGQKPSVEFNKQGVAYLQAKGAMPSNAA